MRPDRTDLAPGLSTPRILTGLWPVADQEQDGAAIDLAAGAEALGAYARASFDALDMADHYGSAELIGGEVARRWTGPGRPLALTKWCPAPGLMTPEVVREGVGERLRRPGVERVDLLQLHWWSFEHPPGSTRCTR